MCARGLEDTIIVGTVNSHHRAPSQSYKTTPEVAEAHDSANQAPEATCVPSAGIAFQEA